MQGGAFDASDASFAERVGTESLFVLACIARGFCTSMHVADLIDLVRLLTDHRADWLDDTEPASSAGLTSYWISAKDRHRKWMEGLGQLEAELAAKPHAGCTAAVWGKWQPLVYEILLAAIAADVVRVACCAKDARFGISEWFPIAESVFGDQQEATTRLLNLLVRRYPVACESRFQFDRIRRRTDYWSDFFVAAWSDSVRVERFARDADRVAEFVESLASPGGASSLAFWNLGCAALEGAFRDVGRVPPYAPEENRRIALGLLATFPRRFWQAVSEGSPWAGHEWLRRADRASRLVDAWLAEATGVGPAG